MYAKSAPSTEQTSSSGNSMDFVRANICGDSFSQLSELYGALYLASYVQVVNTCMYCYNTNMASVKSCKIVASESSNNLQYLVNSYTDTDCSDGETAVFGETYTTGTCNDGGLELVYTPGLTDLSQLGDGLQFWLSSDECSTPGSANIMGVYQDYCYCVNSADDDSDDYDDNYDDDVLPGCVKLQYKNGVAYSTSYASFTSCSGEIIQYNLVESVILVRDVWTPMLFRRMITIQLGITFLCTTSPRIVTA